MHKRIGKWCVWLVVATGLFVALLAGVSEQVPAIHSLCLGLGGECRETAQFVLFTVPVWAWGAAYYLTLVAALAFAPGWLWPLAGAGLGAELALVWIMVSQRLFCPICLANLVVILLLVAVTCSRERFWQWATFCVLALFVSQVAMVRSGPGADRAASGALRSGDEVVARVDGTAITGKELDTALSVRLSELHERIYRLRRDRLDELVRGRVLELEAKARGVDVEELVRQEAEPQAAPVTDAEVEAMAEDSRRSAARFHWSEEELHRRVREFLAKSRRDTAIRSYAETLSPKYGVRILLAPPRLASPDVDLGDSPSLGPADAKVTVVEFSDYQCPACRRGHATVNAMREKYRDRVRWVFKDYPLAMHEDARSAAEASRCAGEQGRFWEYQESLYASAQLNRDRYLEMAAEHGLDRERFARCLDEHTYAAGVEKDLAEVARLGLDGTPAFIVNGRMVSGTPAPDNFSRIIDEALAEAGR